MEDERNGYQSKRLELNINSTIEWLPDKQMWLIITKDLKGKICKYAREITVENKDYYSAIDRMIKILNGIYNLRGLANLWVKYYSHKQQKEWRIRRDF